MNLSLITAPTIEPVTLEDVWAHLRITPVESPQLTSQDAMLTRYITTARIDAENWTHRSFVEQTLRLSAPGFPITGYYNCVHLLRPPVIAVDSVTYFDLDNVASTIDAANYYVTDDQVPQLRFTSSFICPATYWRGDAFRVEYRAGYRSTTESPWSTDVPSPVKDAILIGVEMLYAPLTPQERESMQKAWESLLQAYAVHPVY